MTLDTATTSLAEREGSIASGSMLEQSVPKGEQHQWWFGYERSDVQQHVVKCKKCKKTITGGNTINWFLHLKQKHWAESKGSQTSREESSTAFGVINQADNLHWLNTASPNLWQVAPHFSHRQENRYRRNTLKYCDIISEPISRLDHLIILFYVCFPNRPNFFCNLGCRWFNISAPKSIKQILYWSGHINMSSLISGHLNKSYLGHICLWKINRLKTSLHPHETTILCERYLSRGIEGEHCGETCSIISMHHIWYIQNLRHDFLF